MGVLARPSALLTVPLIAGFIASNAWLLTHGQSHNPCDCFGGFAEMLGFTLTNQVALYLDFAMLALVLIILLCYQGKFLNIRPWFFKRWRS